MLYTKIPAPIPQLPVDENAELLCCGSGHLVHSEGEDVSSIATNSNLTQTRDNYQLCYYHCAQERHGIDNN